MKRSWLGTGFALAGVAAAWVVASWWTSDGTGGPGTTPSDSSLDLAEGERLYAEHCASCHGADLEGQPDWQTPGPDGVLPAPPHDETGHTWHHADDVLFDYVKLGGSGFAQSRNIRIASGMPAFGDTLSDRQIWEVLAFIQSTWPEREREAQAASTRASREQESR